MSKDWAKRKESIYGYESQKHEGYHQANLGIQETKMEIKNIRNHRFETTKRR